MLHVSWVNDIMLIQIKVSHDMPYKTIKEDATKLLQGKKKVVLIVYQYDGY